MKIVVVCAGSLFLIGCVANQSAVEQQVSSEMNGCRTAGRSNVAVARCQNAALLSAVQRTHPRDEDLIRLGTAENLAVAEKLDRGEITQADAQVELSRDMAAINTESQRRNALAATQNQAENEARAEALMSALRATGAAAATAYAPKPHFNCTSNTFMGTTTTDCN